MIEKWKDFWTITGITGTTIPAEIGWTTFLVLSTSKIPYVGIPIAALLGITGAIGTIWLGSNCRFAYKDWYKEYCTM